MSTPEPEAASATVEAPAGGPGAVLKAAREGRGLGLGDVAEALHVGSSLVAAMESDDYAAFGAPVYARGFLRKYAAYLELVPQDVIRRYEALAQDTPPPSLIPAASAGPTPRDYAALRLPAAAIVALVLVGGSFWWWFGRGAGTPSQEPVASTAPVTQPSTAPAAGLPPARGDAGEQAEDLPSPLPPAREAAPAVVPTAAPVLPARAAPAATTSVPGGPAHATPAAGSAPLAPGVRRATPVSVPTATDSTVTGTSGTLVIHGQKDCWVEVYSPSGKRLFYDMVRPGETRSVAGPGPWHVFLGFANGVQVSAGEHAVDIAAVRRGSGTARFVVAADGRIESRT